MKKFLKYAILLLIIPSVILTSCKDEGDDDERTTDAEFQTLITYMQAQNMDLDDILDGWIVPAANIKDDLSSYFIIDIRSAEKYNAAHIPGAVNGSLGTILTDAANADGKPIVVVCYTGQGAGHAVCALRLSGYADAKVLKWGMSGWLTTEDSWSGNTGNIGVANANWIFPAAPVASTEFDDPNITETGNGAAILEARVAAMLSNGFNGVTGSDVLASPGSYFINNYWSETDNAHYGHIAGAYRIQPLTLAGGQYMNLDPDNPLVTYCWTGQTSSVITAYLWVLGYDAKSLKFGSNGMIYDNLEGHKWSAITADLPVE